MRNTYDRIPPRFDGTFLGDFQSEEMYPVQCGTEGKGLVLAGDNGFGNPCALAVWNAQTGTFLPVPRQQSTAVGTALTSLAQLTEAQRRAAAFQNIELTTREGWMKEATDGK